jgi:hypothetical protein
MFSLTSNLPVFARIARVVKQLLADALLTERDREFRRLKSFISS